MPTKRKTLQFHARTLVGVTPAPFPSFIEPCLPTLRPAPPAGEKWQFEFKLDGYRMQIHARGDAVKIFSRNGLDWTGKLEDAPEKILFHAFDLLHLDGIDVRAAPLSDRRRLLAQVVSSTRGGRILMSETMEESGAALVEHAAELGLEGIVAKRTDCPYRSGRVETWIKVKVLKAMRLAIIGFVPAPGNAIAALRLGRRENGALVYAGKVGTGWSRSTAVSVRERLKPFIRPTPPVPVVKRAPRGLSRRSRLTSPRWTSLMTAW